jgi:hypothetical protein
MNDSFWLRRVTLFFFAAMENGLPLPKGEGWGEGERNAIRDENAIFFEQ